MTLDTILAAFGGVGAIGGVVAAVLQALHLEDSRWGGAFIRVLPDIVGMAKHLKETSKGDDDEPTPPQGHCPKCGAVRGPLEPVSLKSKPPSKPPVGPIVGLVVLTWALPACSGEKPAISLMAAAIACHRKGVAITDQPGTCEVRRQRLQALVELDPDCRRAFGDAGTDLPCGDAGGDR